MMQFQNRKSNSYKSNFVQHRRNLDCSQTHRRNLDWSFDNVGFQQLQQQVQTDTWVQLLELPSTYSHDEALLLCQSTEDEWVAWIPGHGEAVLHSSQFYTTELRG